MGSPQAAWLAMPLSRALSVAGSLSFRHPITAKPRKPRPLTQTAYFLRTKRDATVTHRHATPTSPDPPAIFSGGVGLPQALLIPRHPWIPLLWAEALRGLVSINSIDKLWQRMLCCAATSQTYCLTCAGSLGTHTGYGITTHPQRVHGGCTQQG